MKLDINITLGKVSDTCTVSFDNWLKNLTMTKQSSTTFNLTNDTLEEGSHTAYIWVIILITMLNIGVMYSKNLKMAITALNVITICLFLIMSYIQFKK